MRFKQILKYLLLGYMDTFSTKMIDDLKIAFNFKGKSQTFTALTDVIFVVK